MLLIPAIDLKDGQCVRLKPGQPEGEAIFSDDPVEVARRWVDAGAERLQIVDLDGAGTGEPVNAASIHAIVAEFPHIPLQVAGGIHSEETVQAYLNSGVNWVIIGTRAVATPHFINDLCLEFPQHIMVTIDTQDGRLAIEARSKFSNHDLLDTARHLERDGVAAFVVTDVARDGRMKGANIQATIELASAVTVPVFASGGVSSLDDIRALGESEEDNIAGVIVGRALYEGKLDLAEAQQLAASFT